MTYGAFYVSGLQTGTSSGGQQSLGPFAIPFADVVDTQTLSLTSASTTTVAVPSTRERGVVHPTTDHGGESSGVEGVEFRYRQHLVPRLPELLGLPRPRPLLGHLHDRVLFEWDPDDDRGAPVRMSDEPVEGEVEIENPTTTPSGVSSFDETQSPSSQLPDQAPTLPAPATELIPTTTFHDTPSRRRGGRG